MLEPENNHLVDEPVRFTPKATAQLRQIMTDRNLSSEASLRVGIKGGGCAGIDYLLAFDIKSENDFEYRIGDFHLLVDKTHVMHVVGLEIDYLDEGNSRGFVFRGSDFEG
jgi:iron-sulfur cluster assembly protein